MRIVDHVHGFFWQSMTTNNCNSYLIDGPLRVLVDPGHRSLFDHPLELVNCLGAAGVDRGAGEPAPEAARGLMRALEGALGRGRVRWPLPLLRALYPAVEACCQGRRLGPEHEARWLNLAGFLLRPGYGDELDAVRVQALWTLLLQGVIHSRDPSVGAQWWVLWRRVGGGLSAGAQESLAERVTAVLLRGKGTARRRPNPQEVREMWRLLGSLERLPRPVRRQLGREVLNRLKRRAPQPHLLWTLGRLGARAPLYGPLELVLSAREAARWITQLERCQWPAGNAMALALALLARRTGDRHRDIDDRLRQRVLQRMQTHQAPASLIRLVREVVPLDREHRDMVFGESLPDGLVLLG